MEIAKMYIPKGTTQCLVILFAVLFCGVLAGDKEAAKCGHCNREECQPVTQCADYQIIQDTCNCCNVCRSDIHPSKITKAERDAVCGQLQCPKHQLCIMNIQGLPVCRCPTKLACPRRQRRHLCGKDGVTYKSRCFLKVAECSIGKKIRIAHRGPCPGDEADEPADRQARRAERQARREEIRKLRLRERNRRKKAKLYRNGRY